MRTLIFTFLILYSCNVFSQTAEDWYYRGNTKAKLKDYRGALADFTKAIELNPGYA